MGSEVSFEMKTPEEDLEIALYHKVCSFHPDNAERITGMLLEMQEKELQTIYNDESKLMAHIYEAIKVIDIECERENRETLGELLYCEVEKVYKDHGLAEKITGMLLEMNLKDLQHLMQEKSELLAKMSESQAMLQTHREPCESKDNNQETLKEELGEVIFERIVEWYPEEEIAAKLTGMLLEMSINDIDKLIKDNNLLKHKAEEAYKVVTLSL